VGPATDFKYSKSNSNSFKLGSTQNQSFQTQKVKIKYGCEVFNVRDIFP
jgi:hypothetical protein